MRVYFKELYYSFYDRHFKSCQDLLKIVCEHRCVHIYIHTHSYMRLESVWQLIIKHLLRVYNITQNQIIANNRFVTLFSWYSFYLPDCSFSDSFIRYVSSSYQLMMDISQISVLAHLYYCSILFQLVITPPPMDSIIISLCWWFSNGLIQPKPPYWHKVSHFQFPIPYSIIHIT